MVLLEVCANSLQSAINAQIGGAQRIELCENLEQGGTTPSYGLIRACKSQLSIPIHVLIRPRIGDFVYDSNEFEVMLADIQICRELGCEGVVIGVLTNTHNKSEVDIHRCRELVQAAQPMNVTFHRAFDDCGDQFNAMESIISTGCNHILTSGQKANAEQGASRIRDLVQRANGRLVIMPGAGVSSENATKIIKLTGASEIHASAKRSLPADSPGRSMFAASRFQTDSSLVRGIVESLMNVS